jgi:endonuclease/exonuclease/phosphatase family metal-dependent hydrolase
VSVSTEPIRIVSCNTEFAGCAEFGYGAADRRDEQMRLLRALEPDVLALQEMNGCAALGGRRFRHWVIGTGMAQGFLSRANKTTSGHRFDSAILVSGRARVLAEGANRAKYHHVLGWMECEFDGLPAPIEFKHIHLDPFDPRNRTAETAPFEVLAAPGRNSVVIGDANAVGLGFPEPDWNRLPPHLRNGHLGLPGTRWEGIADRSAVEQLALAGLVDLAQALGDQRPTGGFGPNDVERRQDLVILSPDLVPLARNYQVHREFVERGLTDHAVVSFELHPAAPA